MSFMALLTLFCLIVETGIEYDCDCLFLAFKCILRATGCCLSKHRYKCILSTPELVICMSTSVRGTLCFVEPIQSHSLDCRWIVPRVIALNYLSVIDIKLQLRALSVFLHPSCVYHFSVFSSLSLFPSLPVSYAHMVTRY